VDSACLLLGPVSREGRLLLMRVSKTVVSIVIALFLALPAVGQHTGIQPVIWQDRGDVSSLDLLAGSGENRPPAGKFTFVKEDMGGASPKFEVVDGQGVHWKAKLGEEAKPETAATRLLWAAGYFVDESYYLPELRVEKMPAKLSRGSEFVKDGVARGVRLERTVTGREKIGNWSWSSNPFTGTKELNGLRIMMAMINNWDLKEPNNAIYAVSGEATEYAVSDLGGTFGKTGGVGLGRTKSRLEDYSASKFIDSQDSDEVHLTIKSRPFFLLAVDPYHYNKLASRANVGRDIPRADAKWLGHRLGQLSMEQLKDCFRAAGYSTAEVGGFAKVVHSRIADLNKL
jgi:hypothetical protein